EDRGVDGEERPLHSRPQHEHLRERDAPRGRPRPSRRRAGPPALLPSRRPAAAAARRRDSSRRVLRRHGQVRRPLPRRHRHRPRADRAVRPSPPLPRAPLMSTLSKRISEAIEATREEDYLRALTLFVEVYGGEDAPNTLNAKTATGLSYFGLCVALVQKKYKSA